MLLGRLRPLFARVVKNTVKPSRQPIAKQFSSKSTGTKRFSTAAKVMGVASLAASGIWVTKQKFSSKNMSTPTPVDTVSPTHTTHPPVKEIVVGGGITGVMEVYYAWLEAKKRGETIRVTVYDGKTDVSETTISNIYPSLTPDEILSVVPRGSALIEKLKILFSDAGGIRIDDVPGIATSVSGQKFIEEALQDSKDEASHARRTKTLLELGKTAMDAWQEFYDTADDTLKKILEESNFQPCREPRNPGSIKLHDGYRIDLLYGTPNAYKKAEGMKGDYEGIGYKNCKILTPEEVVALDPSLKDFCERNSEVKKDNPSQRVWKNDAVALLRPGGCIDANVFLPKFYEYLKNSMGTYVNAEGKTKDCFRIKYNRKVTDLKYDENGGNKITGLKFQDKDKENKHQYRETKLTFCTGEGTPLKDLGLTEPAHARFAGPSLRLSIPFDPVKMSPEQLAKLKSFNHCMEVHQPGVVLAWQARCMGNTINIGVAGTKAFYADQTPTNDQAFAKNRHLLQLNIINDVLPEFISMALGRDTKGEKLAWSDLECLLRKGIAKRWVGSRAVLYDNGLLLGAVYNKHGFVPNAHATSYLGSGGGSFCHAAVKTSRKYQDPNPDPLTQQVLKDSSSVRTAQTSTMRISPRL